VPAPSQNLFSGDKYKAPPAANQLELAIIGPGYGEAILVHVGDGKWFTVDSCVTPDDKTSCSLRYLRDIGVDPASSVFANVASHWDDDHVAGLAGLVRVCNNSEFILSGAFSREEFNAYTELMKYPMTSRVRSGVAELRGAVDACIVSKRAPVKATANRCVFAAGHFDLSHGLPFKMHALSPSDYEHDNFLMWLASQMPGANQTRFVSVSRRRNDLSTVIHAAIGDHAILLGGDLEEEGDIRTGWSAILSSPGRPQDKSSLFKIPHHGSETGHHHSVWSDMVSTSATVVLAPWRLAGRSLPKHEDKVRILSYSEKAYSTAQLSAKPRRRDNIVEKSIKETTDVFHNLLPSLGMVRFRLDLSQSRDWVSELFGSATTLQDLRVDAPKRRQKARA